MPEKKEQAVVFLARKFKNNGISKKKLTADHAREHW